MKCVEGCKCQCDRDCLCTQTPERIAAWHDARIARTRAEIARLECPQPDAPKPDDWVKADPKWNLGGLEATT